MLHILICCIAMTITAGLSTAQVQQQPPAQTPPSCSNLSCEIQNDWTRYNVMIYGLANAMPDEKYGYKPTPAQQSFGERVLHVAQVNLMLVQALGSKVSVPAIDMNATAKTASMAALQKVGAYGVAVITELGDSGLTARIDSPGPVGWFLGPKVSRQRVLYFLMTHSQD